MLFMFDSVRKPLLLLWILGRILRHLLLAGKTTHNCTAYHPMPHNQKTQSTRFSFVFIFSFFPLALLLICVAEKYIIHVSALTCRFHLHQQRVHTRKTLLNSANRSDSSSQRLRNRQSWQGKWAAVYRRLGKGWTWLLRLCNCFIIMQIGWFWRCVHLIWTSQETFLSTLHSLKVSHLIIVFFLIDLIFFNVKAFV